MPEGTNKVLISYAHLDIGLVAEMTSSLLEAGYVIWWDQDLIPGMNFRRKIGEHISLAQAVIVIWTKQSVGSLFVAEEANIALRKGILVNFLQENNLEQEVRRILSGPITNKASNLDQVCKQVQRLGVCPQPSAAIRDTKLFLTLAGTKVQRSHTFVASSWGSSNTMQAPTPNSSAEVSKSTVLLSFAGEDRIVAEELALELQENGFDVRLRDVASQGDLVRKELDACAATIVLWTKTSCSCESLIGVSAIAQKRVKLIPVLVYVDPTEHLPVGFQSVHAVKFDNLSEIMAAVGYYVHRWGATAHWELDARDIAAILGKTMFQ